MSGFFVSFEGLDKCGKSTQAGLLADHFRALGHAVEQTWEPGRTALGQELRRLLLHANDPVAPDAELLLFAADRAQHVRQVIRPALAAGQVVISDRYVDSTFAYQGYGRGLALERLRLVQQVATGGLMPAVTVWLDVSVATSRARLAGGQKDRLESESDAWFARVKDGYAALCAQSAGRMVRIDGEQSVEAVFQKVLAAVMPCFLMEHSAPGRV